MNPNGFPEGRVSSRPAAMQTSTSAKIKLRLKHTCFAPTLDFQIEEGRVMEGRVPSRPASWAGTI
tara:strand:+ start:2754 stop:2948 length:195 start_codon:yes stop_codon:yes gene_type:complete